MKKFFMGLLAIVIVAVIFFVYSGLFTAVTVLEKRMGSYMLVYEEMSGSYSNAGKVMDRVYQTLVDDFAVETFRGFGLYFDNPKMVAEEKLRSEIGCILGDKDLDKKDKISKKFKIKVFPAQDCFIAEFPFKTKLSMFIGLFKAYPELEKYRSEKGYKETPALEIYDVPNKNIIYAFPIVR